MFKKYIKILVILLVAGLTSCSLYKAKAEKMIYEFPKLTGQYKVGTMQRHIVDQNRQEPNNPSEKRELMAQLWYPADIKYENPLEVYGKTELESTKAAYRDLKFSEEDISCLDRTFCHAISDAVPLKNHKFPTVIFSHGYGTSPSIYTALCEELASNGFVVVAISHTYYTYQTIFPDGRTISASPEKLQTPPTSNDFKIWLDDVKCVLEQIKKWNLDSSDAFSGLFDMEKIGIFGHSYGGAVAFEMTATDPEIKTGIALDVGLFGQATLSDMHKPFMFIMGGTSVQNLYLSDEELAQKFSQPVELVKKNREQMHDQLQDSLETHKKIAKELNLTTNPSCVIIPKLEHGGFADLLIYKELKLPVHKDQMKTIDMQTGLVDGFEVNKMLNEYIVNFFNKNLR